MSTFHRQYEVQYSVCYYDIPLIPVWPSDPLDDRPTAAMCVSVAPSLTRQMGLVPLPWKGLAGVWLGMGSIMDRYSLLYKVQVDSHQAPSFCLPVALLAEQRCVVYRVLRQSGREFENLPDCTGYVGWTR